MASGEGPSGFLILHGYENHRPIGHWQRWLAEALAHRGHVVRYPQLPDPDAPVLERWREVVLAELETLRREVDGGTVTVVAHSASAVLWLNERQSGSTPGVDRVAIVSPPEAGVMAGIPAVAAFAWRPNALRPAAGTAADHSPQDHDAPLDLGARGAHPGDAVVILGSDDPFAPHGAQGIAPYVAAPVVELPGGGHIVPGTGYGPWPAMLDWCEGRAAFV